MTKTRILIIFAFVLFLALPLTAKAFEIKSGNTIYVAEEEIIKGNLYAGGNIITVDGTIEGDVICGGQTININGTVEGDVICGGQTININGTVNGNIRVAGNSINLNGRVARNAMAFGQQINLGNKADVGWSLLIAGQKGEIRGKIGNDLYGGASEITIAGEVGNDVRLKLDNSKDKSLIITSGASIGGDVTYTSKNDASIADDTLIAGEVVHNLPKVKNYRKGILKGWAAGKIYSIFASLAIGLVLISLWRKQTLELTDKMLKKIGPSIGWGVIAMFLTPIISIILCFTIIGIPLAIILMAIWLIVMVIGKILVGILVGRSILSKLWPKKKDSLIWAMIIGIIIVKIIFSIPFVGWILALIAIWWGLGGIWLQFRKS